VTEDAVEQAILGFERAKARKDQDEAGRQHALLSQMLSDAKGQAPRYGDSFWDMLNVTDPKDPDTWTLRSYEYRTTGDGSLWIPGSVRRTDRTPGAAFHAHTMSRLSDPVTWKQDKNGRWIAGDGNMLMTHPGLADRGGFDGDGDMSNGHYFAINPRTGTPYDRDNSDMNKLRERQLVLSNELLAIQVDEYQRLPEELLLEKIDKTYLDGVTLAGGKTLGQQVEEDNSGRENLSALRDLRKASEMSERARSSTQTRGIVVARLRQIDYALIVGGLGFKNITVGWPGGEISTSRGTDPDPVSDSVLHDLMQNLVNINIDDLNRIFFVCFLKLFELGCHCLTRSAPSS
jgi:hypothetical protein